MTKLFTVGYSGLNAEQFVELLRANNVDVVCDVRSTPYSTYKPDFSRGAFRAFLNKSAIKYIFMGDQLGARPKDRSCYVNGQATYQKIADTAAFREGLDRLREGINSLILALVCSERDPVECHRAVLVCRYLPDLHSFISHIHTDGKIERHEQFEERLVRIQKLAPPPLLRQPGDWERSIAMAYERQGNAIGYRERSYDREQEPAE